MTNFTPLNEVHYITGQNSFGAVAVGDYNSDGKSDLAITFGNSLLIYAGKGDGTFANFVTYQMPANAKILRSADLNSDGRVDLVVPFGNSFNIGNLGLAVLLANQNGGFSQTIHSLSAAPDDVVIGDFDGDAKTDLLLTNSPVSYATLFSGNGNGIFIPQTPVLTVRDISIGSGSSFSPAIGAAADFNQDQKLDLILANGNGPSAIFYNETPKSPCLTVNNVEVPEGNNSTINAQFTVSLSAAATQTVTVDYRIVGRNARNNNDFNGVMGTLQFAPGMQTQTVSVPVRGDVSDEYDETFQLVLSNPLNATLVDAIGVGTIKDDDEAPSVVIGDASIVEGSGGNPRQITFNVSLSSPTGRKAKVEFKTVDGTAAAGSDYSSATGTVVFNADEATKQIAVAINPDAFVEPDELFKIKLSNPSNLII